MASQELRGVIFILVGMLIFSIQDVLIRELAENGSLLQVLTIRGLIGGFVILTFLKLTKRKISLKSAYPLLAFTRVILFFCGFLCFYFALSFMGLAEATALFFASPLFITLISKFALKEDVGLFRLAAIFTGFIGVLFIVQPSPERLNLIALFPLFTAFTYAVSMMIARYTKEKDTIWQQMLQLYFGSLFFGGLTSFILFAFDINESLLPTAGYLLRQWTFSDISVLGLVAIIASIGSVGMLLLTQAYRVGSPAIIAPFEYSLLFLAGAWGYYLFGEIPDQYSVIGMVLIVFSSLFIFFREGIRKKPLAVKTSLRT